MFKLLKIFKISGARSFDESIERIRKTIRITRLQKTEKAIVTKS